MVKRSEGLLVERPMGEVLVMKTGTEEAHALNQAAGIVFDLCDGDISKSEMAVAIEKKLGLPADPEIVDLALNELGDAGLITFQGPDEMPQVTRRSLVRRLSLSFAAAALLPIVETILVPSAAAQTSGPVAPVSIQPIPVAVVPVAVPVTGPRPRPRPAPRSS